MRWTWTVLAAAIAATACSNDAPVQQAGPEILQVATAPGVNIEVVDWGGSGNPPLVFLAGGGHTAHEFDEFAPLLTEDFRVLGITRRGIGASTGSPERIDDHVSDIVGVLDSLKLGSVVLVGHSFAGMEMALFGETYSDRCRGLVYLDAAYDYTDPELADVFQAAPPPEPPMMTRADSASIETALAFNQRTQGFAIPESEIRATVLLDEAGRLTGRKPSTATQVEPRTPRWDAVQCPGLGLYAVTAPLQTWLPYYMARYDSLDAGERERGEAYVQAFGAWTAKHRDAFGRLPQNQVVEFHGAGHYFFMTRPHEAADAIRRFVSGLGEPNG